MLAARIAGLGAYLPERRVTNEELEARLGIPANWIERATGVRERRYAGDETAAGMAAVAARRSLNAAGLTLTDLDAVVGASAAPQQTIPCTAALVARELGLPDGQVACFDLNATCLSFPFALHTVAALLAAGAHRTVLVFSSEIASRSLNPQERESAVLFGDAAAAAIVTRTGPGESGAIWGARFATHPSGADLTVVLGGGTLHHPNDPATRPEMNLFRMEGPAVFRQGARLIGPFLDAFLDDVGWDRPGIAAVIPHQASRHALDQLTARLGFTAEQVVNNLALRGNCVAASIPLALTEAIDCGRIRRGDRVLLGGTGAGLTLGALAMTY
jgi:3-oxoacyl-[acyl-carrier-protein] synthase-3